MGGRKHGKNQLFDGMEEWWSDDDEDGGYYDEAESDEEADQKEAAEEPPRQRPSAFSLADALGASPAVSGASGTDPKRPVIPKSAPAKNSAAEPAAAKKKPNVRVPVASVALSAATQPADGGNGARRRSGKADPSALDDGSLLCVASFLPLPSIASLSCVNRRFDVLLSSDFLYCRPPRSVGDAPQACKGGGEGRPPKSGGSGGGGSRSGGSGSLLPCLRAVSLPVLLPAVAPPDDNPRPKGVARKFAIESQLYGPADPRQQTTRRTFGFVDQVSTKDAKLNDMTFLDRRTLAYTTMDAPKIALRDVVSSKTTTVALSNCADVCQSAFGPKRRLCATLSNRPGGGLRNLTVVDLSPAAAGPGGNAGNILWQHGYDEAKALGATLAFDECEDRLLFGTNRSCRVYDARLGKELWASNDGFIDSCLFHGNSSVVVLRGNAIEVFDVQEDGRKCVARARVPGGQPVAQAVSLAGKLFVATGSGLFCLDTGAVCGTATARSDERQRGPPAGEEQSLRKIASSSHGTPLLAVGNGKLCVSVGRRITVLDPRNPSAVWASYELDRHGAHDAQGIVVDSTKLVLSAQERDRYLRPRPSLNILPIDAFVRSAAVEGGIPHIVSIAQPFINGPSSFNNSPWQVSKIVLKGNFLAISFSYPDTTFVTQPTETGAVRSVPVRNERFAIRVVNIQREDHSDPGSYWKVKADREKDQRRRHEMMERLRKESKKAEADRNGADANEVLAEEEERKQKIYRRKEAKKEAQRTSRAKDKAVTQQMSYTRRTKKT